MATNRLAAPVKGRAASNDGFRGAPQNTVKKRYGARSFHPCFTGGAGCSYPWLDQLNDDFIPER
jgi:hypothetical protein